MFIILLITARLLSVESFGIYNYTVAFTILFSLLADFGISRAVSKFVAEYNVNDKSKINFIFFNSGLILISLAALFTIIILFFADEIIGKNFNYIYYLIPTFFLLPLTSLVDGIYVGLKKFKEISAASLVSGIISLIISYFLIREYKLIGALVSFNLYYLILFLFSFIMLKEYKFKYNKAVFSEIWKYSLIIGLSSVGHFLYAKANSIILGKYDLFAEVGYIELIDKIFTMLAFPFMILGQIISPQVTEYSAIRSYTKVEAYFKKILTFTIPLSLVITLLSWFLLPPIMNIFLPEYLNTNFLKLFNLLIIHLPLILITNSLSQPFIIATGLAKYSLITIPFGILNVILSIIFINNFGFMGVAYSILITSIGSKLLTYYLVYKNVNRYK